MATYGHFGVIVKTSDAKAPEQCLCGRPPTLLCVDCGRRRCLQCLVFDEKKKDHLCQDCRRWRAIMHHETDVLASMPRTPSWGST